MAGNSVKLEFAGDASKLQAAGKKAEIITEGVGKSATAAGEDFRRASKDSADFTDRLGSLGAGVSGMTDAVDSAGASLQAMADIQDSSRATAVKLARAELDVEQAMADEEQAAVDLKQAQRDLNQSKIDGKQASVDLEQAEIDARQAKLDAKTAQEEYNAAIKEHGAGSAEAAQAAIDLTQAQSDLNQARVDEEQAIEDAKQAQLDGTQAVVDARQAVIDGKEAQLNLNDAMSAANPSGLQKWADKLQLITPLLSAAVGVLGLVTAAQWAWNAAQLASPITWIVIGIGVLIVAVVLLAKNWDKVKRAGAAAWRWIKDAASDTWGFLKRIPGMLVRSYAGIARTISAPFRAAFNFIADAWNYTIGSLSWSVPNWIPGIGGNSISVPNLPKFHDGGRVPGAPGSEMLAILQAGETVTPATGSTEPVHVTVVMNADVLIEAMAKGVRRRGGNVQRVLGTAGAAHG